ncbi:DUF6879 family protein [Streptomyces luteolus]|uniref:DUF6879 domain-containing protein n=1 Tax=Streptomyces luteolus TaxID=3043615 RepID=A0ABT6SV52_9ACTN|nr:DUF6879 family protein [Streptomyces sp. B-S-A12]MDI3419494.1 hypothetical protein [Streptomyces sp. B-S-A12]
MPQSVPSFVELLRGCEKSAVHLEMRDSYSVANERAQFDAWRAGSDASRTDPQLRQAWLDIVQETTGRGVEMRRARIVSEPVSEYIQYEHAGTQLNIDAGEQVRWLPRRQASDIALPGNDFWIYDGQLVKFNHFTGSGSSAGQEMTHDPAVARLCLTAFEAVWERAVPHAQFAI